MLKVAVVGASGFVGSRTVELLHQKELVEVSPILRTPTSAARLPASVPNYRIANALDQVALQKAFAGCEIVVHSVLGSPGLVRGTIAPTYRAAEAAGVRRIVYLSTASVHGQAPPPGTDECTPLSDRQPLEGNNAKVQAERRLLKLRKTGSVEVVILRPGIVFGPNSRWVVDCADALLNGSACLVEGGHGICNTTYIDNLVHAIQLAMEAPNADGEAFLIGDREVVRWVDFYGAIAEAFGIDINQIPSILCPEFTQKSWRKRFSESIWSSELLQKGLSLVSDDVKQALKQKAFFWKKARKSINQNTATPSAPAVNQMLALLHQCQHKFPSTKAEKLLGYEPIVSFSEGCRCSIDWLAEKGYPVVIRHC